MSARAGTPSGVQAGERPPLVLASASPQCRAILTRLGIAFQVRPSGVQELIQGEPATVAVENALRKARASRDRSTIEGIVTDWRSTPEWEAHPPGHAAGAPIGQPAGAEIVLGVDTLVELGGRIYGKPQGKDQARETLQALSGATHTVISGLALIQGAQERTALARTSVSFRALDPSTIDWYLGTGEWRERAGGYAIQGAGAALVREIAGDYENVVGLPVAALLDLCPKLLL